jgi:hypothetical protein
VMMDMSAQIHRSGAGLFPQVRYANGKLDRGLYLSHQTLTFLGGRRNDKISQDIRDNDGSTTQFGTPLLTIDLAGLGSPKQPQFL